MSALSFDFQVLPGIRGWGVTNSLQPFVPFWWRRSRAVDMGLFEPAQAHVLPCFASFRVDGNSTCNHFGLFGSKAKVVLIDDEAAAKSRLETETCLQGEMVSEQD